MKQFSILLVAFALVQLSFALEATPFRGLKQQTADKDRRLSSKSSKSSKHSKGDDDYYYSKGYSSKGKGKGKGSKGYSSSSDYTPSSSSSSDPPPPSSSSSSDDSPPSSSSSDDPPPPSSSGSSDDPPPPSSSGSSDDGYAPSSDDGMGSDDYHGKGKGKGKGKGYYVDDKKLHLYTPKPHLNVFPTDYDCKEDPKLCPGTFVAGKQDLYYDKYFHHPAGYSIGHCLIVEESPDHPPKKHTYCVLSIYIFKDDVKYAEIAAAGEGLVGAGVELLVTAAADEYFGYEGSVHVVNTEKYQEYKIKLEKYYYKHY